MNRHRMSRSKSTVKSKRNSSPSREKKQDRRRPLLKPNETEEEAIIRRFQDAQRMARFRAKRKKALEEEKALKAASFDEISVISELRRRNITFEIINSIVSVPESHQSQKYFSVKNPPIVVQQLSGESKYSQLLGVIEQLGKDIKLTYAGSRSSAEKLKTGIVQARMLIKECLLEIEINSRG